MKGYKMTRPNGTVHGGRTMVTYKRKGQTLTFNGNEFDKFVDMVNATKEQRDIIKEQKDEKLKIGGYDEFENKVHAAIRVYKELEDMEDEPMDGDDTQDFADRVKDIADFQEGNTEESESRDVIWNPNAHAAAVGMEKLLDDIDTLSDMMKPEKTPYYDAVMRLVEKRHGWRVTKEE